MSSIHIWPFCTLIFRHITYSVILGYNLQHHFAYFSIDAPSHWHGLQSVADSVTNNWITLSWKYLEYYYLSARSLSSKLSWTSSSSSTKPLSSASNKSRLLRERFTRWNHCGTYTFWVRMTHPCNPPYYTLMRLSATTSDVPGMCSIRYFHFDRKICNVVSFRTVELGKYTRFLWSVRTINCCFPTIRETDTWRSR